LLLFSFILEIGKLPFGLSISEVVRDFSFL
jgi:hypothetical protein